MKLKQKYTQQTASVGLNLKRSFPWWTLLFLLLLPLLLFINISKEIKVKTVIDIGNQSISNVSVDLVFFSRQFFSFKEMKFNFKKTEKINAKTNAKGEVVFNTGVKTTLFQYLFFSSDEFVVNAVIECSKGSAKDKFPRHKSSQIIELKLLTEKLELLNFLVIDDESKEPIVEADVEINYTYLNYTFSDSLKTAITGEVEFENIPVCADINVVGKRYGYENDTIENSVENIVGQPEPTDEIKIKRTLKLKPIKDIIRFYVKELKTEQPIPNATAELLIENKIVQTTKTNLNGNGIFVPGEGQFEETHIIKLMQIHAYHEFYNDTIHPRTPVKVESFNQRNEKERTAYLRPKTNNYSFRNTINEKCGVLLEGVTNYVKIERSGQPTRELTVISNTYGVFIVGDLQYSDKIIISASKTGFEGNNYTVNGQTVEFLFLSSNNMACENKVDIPLTREDPPLPMIECNETQASGQGPLEDIKMMDLGKKGEFTLYYNMYDTYPDRITIFCGTGTGGKILFNLETLNEETVTINNLDCDSNIITIRIIPTNDDDTAWEYKITCPK